MKFLHLFADEEGISHFIDREIELNLSDFAPPAQPLLLSNGLICRQLVYLTLPVGWGGAQHRSPKRQVAFCLSGQLKVMAGDGESRIIKTGGIWQMEDTDGAGHTTTVVGDEAVRLAIVQLE